MPTTILVADDDPDILEVITVLLTQEGYQIVACSNGLKALQQIDVQRPALAIIDLSMPVMDGSELIQRIRRQPGPQLPIILMTAFINLTMLEALQVDAYLAKPFDLEELLTHVQIFAGPPESSAAVEATSNRFSRLPSREGPLLH
ncbi:MAG TPA: response regulator [Ktedonobacterales bacterium]|jgi:CheY-like chemotaxis protein